MQLRNYMPKTLFGRMLAIILVPMILVQVVTVFIFYERHWDSVTRQMAASLAGDIDFIVTQAGANPDQDGLRVLADTASRYSDIQLAYSQDKILTPYSQPDRSAPYAEEAFAGVLDSKLEYPWWIDLRSDPDYILIHIQLAEGVLELQAGRKRLISSTSWTFFGWTVGSSLFLFCIALLFMQAQVRPIISLANAARQLGMGRQSDDWHLQGAKEVRLVGRAFSAMRHRINRQLTERTSMLAGVSHDLRTPLTRMRLQLALMPQSAESTELQQDIDELEQMIEGYLAFARGEGTEKTASANITDVLETLKQGFDRTHKNKLTLLIPETPLPDFPMRLQAMKRALENVIGNALRYANHTEVRTKFRDDIVSIFIDDDGPGIEDGFKKDALRPFVRGEQSRNRQTGGTGLGLAIANDIVLSHGGELTLHDSPKGGLRVLISLPV